MQKNTAEIEKIIANLAVKDYSASINRSEEHTSDSSHVSISYAVFCLKKKKNKTKKKTNSRNNQVTRT